MPRFVQRSVVLAAAFLLAACQSPPPSPSFSDISFADRPPILLDVAEIVIDVPYVEPLEPPHVGETFPVPPLRAARDWASQRLRAVGQRGTATVTIVEAGAVEAELERSGGLRGMFTKEQAQRYEVTIAVQIRAVDPEGPRTARAEARVKRSITVPENADLNEREEIQYELTRQTMDDFDQAMTNQVRRHMGQFMR